MGNLAAGAIGSLITLGVAFFARLVAVPAEIRANDRRARELDDDLATWAADRTVALRRELHADRNALGARSAIESGEYAHRLGLTKERALEEWRKEERSTRRAIAAIYDREGLLHRGWRRVGWGGRRHELLAAGHANPLLDYWRQPPASPGMRARGESGREIDDPTKRSLSTALTAASSDPNAYR